MSQPATEAEATTIWDAARTGDQDRIHLLLESDGELANARDEAGNSPLLLALYHRQREVVASLLERGAVPNLWESAMVGDAPRVAEFLGANPESVNALSHDGWTPLHGAAFFGHLDVLRELIGRGADPNTLSGNPARNTALHAALAGPLGIAGVEYLVISGARVNAQQTGGYTALHAAAMHGDRPMVEMLLAHGADRHLASEDGRTAADLALAGGHPEVAALLAG